MLGQRLEPTCRLPRFVDELEAKREFSCLKVMSLSRFASGNHRLGTKRSSKLLKTVYTIRARFSGRSSTISFRRPWQLLTSPFEDF